jgi:hypothetical protein
MANSKVSSDFSKFLAKNATAVKEAKEADNSMQTCAMPIGWKGQVVCVDAVADKGKDRKDDKGNVQEGREFIRLDFNVINDEKYGGKKCSLLWSFFDSEKASATDRFEWCLNEMENLGLPRETRTEFSDISEVLDFFSSSDEVFEAEVVHNAYRRGDQKEIKVRRVETVDSSASMSPTDVAPASGVKKGDEVKYLGKTWDVVDIDGDDVQIKSRTTGASRGVKLADLE